MLGSQSPRESRVRRRGLGKLSALEAKNATPGIHGDGGGLWLQVTPAGVRSWLFRYTLRGRTRAMGLGPLHTVSLAEAREKALECRKLLLERIDPMQARDERHSAALVNTARTMTFRRCAEAYIAAHRSGWRNAKHAKQWGATLETYAYPVIGEMPVSGVDTALVVKIIEPIWQDKNETARRLRGRMEAVLDWAAVRGFRHGENPARWKGHLAKLLTHSRRVEHHAALPYTEIGALMGELRAIEVTSARALEFLILTAARTSEVTGATWREVDFEQKTWTVPAARIKAGKEHRVPLSPAALRILETMRAQRLAVTPKLSPDAFVFPGARSGRSLSNIAMLLLLRRMGRGEFTSQGFRSSFRDWAAERTNFAREVAEAALAHAVGDKVEAAYRRGDLFAKRQQLMDAWAKYCGSAAKPGGADVVAMHAR